MEHAEYDALCKDIISTCLKMNALGINQGTSGNVSAKIDTTRFAITPSGCAYETLEPKDIVIVEIKPRGDDRSPGKSIEPSANLLAHDKCKASTDFQIASRLLNGASITTFTESMLRPKRSFIHIPPSAQVGFVFKIQHNICG